MPIQKLHNCEVLKGYTSFWLLLHMEEIQNYKMEEVCAL